MLSSAIFAQNINNSRRNVRRQSIENRWTPVERAEIMAEQLKLTDAEKAQVKTLLEKNEKERIAQVEEQRAKRGYSRTDRETHRAEMQELRDKAILENDAELEKIIGKEKLDQWKIYRAEVRMNRPAYTRRR